MEAEMRVRDCIGCDSFPCMDVQHSRYIVPDIDIDPEIIRMIMISEAAPENPDDYYYAKGQPLFEQTTVQAFHQAGAEAAAIQELLEMGVCG
jgi:hypothetical protein